MAKTITSTLAQPQVATVALRTRGGGGVGARVEVTGGGLLAIGALVSAILLSSAVIVAVAGAAHKRG